MGGGKTGKNAINNLVNFENTDFSSLTKPVAIGMDKYFEKIDSLGKKKRHQALHKQIRYHLFKTDIFYFYK